MRHQTSPIRPTRHAAGIYRGRGRPAPRRVSLYVALHRHDRHAEPKTFHADRTSTAPDPITLAAATWLACGIVLLGLTPLPLRDATLGWSPAFWGLAAPLVVLLVRCVSTLPRSKQLS